MRLGDVARAIKGTLAGDAAHEVTRLVHPADAGGPGDLAVALTGDAIAALPGSPAGAAVVKPGSPADGRALILFDGHERMAMAILTRLFDRATPPPAGIDPRATVAADAVLGERVGIGPGATVGPNCAIGAGSAIHAGASLGAGVIVGRDCVVHSGARLCDRVRLGDRVTVYPNAVIGGDGFSIIPLRNPDGSRNPLARPERLRSLGTVVVGDDVDIGAGTTIDRGTLRDTRIGAGSKIDNQVQIAHNAVIGEDCIVCGMVGIAGSAEIGDRVILAAGSGVSDHVRIGADVTVTALAAVASDVPAGMIVDGIPAMPREQAAERFMNLGRLRMLYPRVDDLKKRLEALEKAAKGG